ncbi:MAG TPA: dihydrodipicolinate synthase family protein [Candidatus Acidoferrales bacterium]|nr:dihydrodipicolinate synthase family protein [Candidatus Acidoferrales bacterium]
MELRGIFAPITTPLSTAGEELALEHLKQNFDVYNKTNLAGYVVAGSTGEAILLSWDETERLFAAVTEHASRDKILVAGTATESTAETIVRTRRAASLGYQVALVRTPHYYKPYMTHAALLNYYRAVADASPIPLLIYSIPQFTGVEVPGELIARLGEHPNICGIKDSWGKLPVVQEIITAAPKRFQTLVGAASIIEPSIRIGALGGILGVACVAPALCAELYAAASAGQSARADELQKKLAPIAQKCVNETGPAGVKFAMDCLGMYGGPVRRPLLPLSQEQQAAVKSVLATLETVVAIR